MPSSTPDPTPPVLAVEGLTVIRNRIPLLAEVRWSVARGEHWVILGANGSGKTSLLATLTGYLTPTAGTLDLLGQRYGDSDWLGLRRRVGLVSSSLRQRMHDDEPAVSIVVGGLHGAIDLRHRLPPREVRAAKAMLAETGCADLALRAWACLSQGERQKVLIARALIARPELLILDEPCAGLDPVAREWFLEFIDGLTRASSPSLVLVTHHVEEIMPGFGQALILRKGRVMASGPVERVLTSRTLSDALGAPLRLRRGATGRYTLAFGVPAGAARARRTN